MLTPMFATALLALAGIHAVILFDLFTFFAAFLSLLFLGEAARQPPPALPVQRACFVVPGRGCAS